MLHRAAGNAYSWWWASHIRTKQSKWLEENLQDMEERVSDMIQIIDNDGDSFAQRAEMYYRKRPELLNSLEESYRSYRALAERYDHLSTELQSANRTIATVFPEQVQFSMEDEEEESLQEASISNSREKLSKNLPNASQSNIPKVPQPPVKDLRSPSMMLSRKKQIKGTASSAKVATRPTTGLSKTEALEEIDKLQKGILVLQTEKEFVKCLYEHNYARYWDIEDQISEMQTAVSNLQDEFGIGMVIEDEDARTLMAATALKSCQAALDKLKARQGQSAENAKIESARIEEANQKFQNLKDKYLPNQINEQVSASAELDEAGELRTEDQEVLDLETRTQKIKNDLDENSGSSLSVTQLTETIDELVDKVVSLETEVSSQATMVKQLQLETDELNAHVQNLEEDKQALLQDSDYMKNKLKELEEELNGVKYLSRSFKKHNDNLQSKFTETSCKLDHLNEKLPTIKLEEEIENTGVFREKRSLPTGGVEDAEQRELQDSSDISVVTEAMATEEPKKSEEEEIHAILEAGHGLNSVSDVANGNIRGDKDGSHDNSEEQRIEEGEDGSSWRHQFLNGTEDREQILIEEYTSILRNYNDVKKKLHETERKNRDGIFELAMQIRELRHVNSVKDQQIQSLRQQLRTPQSYLDENLETYSTYAYSQQEGSQECITEVANTPDLSYYPLNSTEQLTIDSLAGYKSTGNIEKSTAVTEPKDAVKNGKTGENQTDHVNKHNSPTTVVDKLRSDIDYMLEENLELWLRFSTAFHQIQKFRSSIRDLQAEWLKVKDSKMHEGDTKNQILRSETRPIFKHLREIQTELTLWLESNKVLLEELQDRFISLSEIQEEIGKIANEGSNTEDAKMNHYQAGKFQGEVINMKQENRKIAGELQSGLERVRALQVEVEETLEKLEDELGLSASKSRSSSTKSSSSRPRIPLRSFLFGVKLKRHKQAKQSVLSCVNPVQQKQNTHLATHSSRLV